MSLIKLTNVYKKFSHHGLDLSILEEINLSINHQELVVILGVSGSGKTTLLNIIDQLENINSGDLFIEKNLRLSYVTQQAHFIEELSIKDNLVFTSLKYRTDILKYCSYFNCLDLLDKKPSYLSGGEKQRINIIRALLLNPQVLILDEPTASLDYENKLKVIHLLEDLVIKEKLSLIIVTHDNDVVSYLKNKSVYELKNKKLTKIN